MDIYHNIEQNKRVRFADDVVDEIESGGFRPDSSGLVWLSDRPLGDGCGIFTGLVVHIPDPAVGALEAYRQPGDGIELYLDVAVYAVPSQIINRYPRERWYPREGELVE